MRWPWQKRTATAPQIPPYPVQQQQLRCNNSNSGATTATPVQQQHVRVQQEHRPKEPGIEVQEHDTSQMSQTGVFKAWKRLTGQ